MNAGAKVKQNGSMLIDLKMSLIQKTAYLVLINLQKTTSSKYIISTQKGESTDLTPTTYKSMARNLSCNSVRNTCHMSVIRFLGQKTGSKTTNQLWSTKILVI